MPRLFLDDDAQAVADEFLARVRTALSHANASEMEPNPVALLISEPPIPDPTASSAARMLPIIVPAQQIVPLLQSAVKQVRTSAVLLVFPGEVHRAGPMNPLQPMLPDGQQALFVIAVERGLPAVGQLHPFDTSGDGSYVFHTHAVESMVQAPPDAVFGGSMDSVFGPLPKVQ